MNEVPMPNTCHPSLGHLADMVRSARTDIPSLRYIKHRPLIARVGDGDKPVETLPTSIATLTRQKCTGPAPYVGRPFAYLWWAWVTDDGTNRAITTDTELAYTSNTMNPFEW